MADMYKFEDKEIYAIISDNLTYTDCVYCLCRMCINMLDVCKMCFMCQFQCFPMCSCRWFVPFVFKYEPYKSYFRELEKLRGAKYDIISRFE